MVEKIFESLRNSKVVLFGAAENGKNMLEQLMKRGIRPAYFVDNSRGVEVVEFADSSGKGDSFAVHAPEVLFSEDKSSLKVIITPYAPSYVIIEAQMREMGFGECLVSANVKSCYMLQNYLMFMNEGLQFCCEPMANFNDALPIFPYLKTAKETITNFLEERKTIIDDLNNDCDVTDKPCKTCPRLHDRFQLSDADNIKLKLIAIGNQPTVCQSRCIYCEVYKNSKNTYEAVKQSRYPEMIAEIVRYLQNNDYIAHDCLFQFGGGEISMFPQKDLLLDVAAGNRSKFFTNAFLFEQKIADSLRNNSSLINMSLDSGTRETFKLVKGFDLFEKVVDNLKNYRNYGEMELKYNIISGVNDGDEDIDGIVDVLKQLNLRNLNLCFDFNMPLRTTFFPIVKFVQKLKENGLNFVFHTYYSSSQVDNFIQQFYVPAFQSGYEQKYNHLRKVYRDEYISDYRGYRMYLYLTEIKELIKQFKEGTSFALLGSASLDQYIVSAFQELGIPLQTPGLPYKESYDATKDSADMFIIRNKGKFSNVKAYIESKGGNGRRLLDVENYYYSFEPAKLFLELNIANEYIKQ